MNCLEVTEALAHVDRPYAGETIRVVGVLQCTACGWCVIEWLGGCGDCCDDWYTCERCGTTAGMYEDMAARVCP